MEHQNLVESIHTLVEVPMIRWITDPDEGSWKFNKNFEDFRHLQVS
jgi:hypothetical protein